MQHPWPGTVQPPFMGTQTLPGHGLGNWSRTDCPLHSSTTPRQAEEGGTIPECCYGETEAQASTTCRDGLGLVHDGASELAVTLYKQLCPCYGKHPTSKLGEKGDMEVTCQGTHCVVLGVTHAAQHLHPITASTGLWQPPCPRSRAGRQVQVPIGPRVFPWDLGHPHSSTHPW